MIEIYIDNHDNPVHVENTVKEFSVEIEHADSVTCVTAHKEMIGVIEQFKLDIMFKREKP